MRHSKNILFVLLVIYAVQLRAQKDSAIVLDEVILSDAKLLHFSNGKRITVLSDSILQRNNASLTDLLKYNSTIYFKEYGYGMTSTVSFRGTNSSQTAVIWNGINVNSQLTGQTDFNTIMPQNFGSVVVRSGGGGVQYGSGAVGGTIHLKDKFSFQNHFNTNVGLSYGSYNTKRYNYNASKGSKNTYASIGADYIVSDNDYKYLGTDRKNENGNFENISIRANGGYLLNKFNLIKFYHTTFVGDRNFSGTLTAPSDDTYKVLNSRNLVEWSNFNTHRITRLKFAYLFEKYNYFPNKNRSEFSFGNTKNFIINYDYKYSFDAITLNGILEFNTVKAEGESIQEAKRDQFSGTLLFLHTLNNGFSYGVNLRKEIVSDYKSPFLISVDGKYKISSDYTINLNVSKNYRIPTFNDLYWIGAGARGNKDVLPESSWQAEIGQTLESKKFTLGTTVYYIISNDLISWRPDDKGIWRAINIKDVTNYGLEATFEFTHNWSNSSLKWNNQYAFVRSVDNETKKQLIYVPKHNVTSGIGYQYKKWEVYKQLLFTSSIYTTTDNSEKLSGYVVANLGVNRSFNLKNAINCVASIQINNLFNKNYQNVAYRPMPNRNFTLKLIFKL
ncbi:MAG: TonB-dependent receptor [Cellulophaga sp.]